MIKDIPGASERRQSPRYEISLPIDFVLSNGKIITVNTRNVSSYGLQIVCDSWVTDEIEPRGLQSHMISHIKLKVITELPKVKVKALIKTANTTENTKKAVEVKAERTAPKGKKKKQLERDAKLKGAQKARDAQENKKKGKAKIENPNAPQRIEVRSDGTIVPRHGEEPVKVKEVKTGVLARFWKWFNS